MELIFSFYINLLHKRRIKPNNLLLMSAASHLRRGKYCGCYGIIYVFYVKGIDKNCKSVYNSIISSELDASGTLVVVL